MADLDVVSLGQLIADVIVRPVDQFPQLGTAAAIQQLELRAGGCAQNTGMILQKLGLATGLAGMVGPDVFGTFLLNNLTRSGIDTECVRTSPDTNTSSVIVLISSSGERSFLYRPGSTEGYCLEDVDFEMLLKSRLVHIGGIMKMIGLDTAKLLQRAKQSGLTTSIDTDWDTTGQWLSRVEDCLAYTDLFFTSIEEARLISRQDSPQDMGSFFLDRGVNTFVVKMGEKGCYVRTSDSKLTMPAFKIDVVDTTGAGDAFVAGFLTGQLNRWSLERSARIANACGALCATKVGTTDGIKDLNATLAFAEGE